MFKKAYAPCLQSALPLSCVSLITRSLRDPCLMSSFLKLFKTSAAVEILCVNDITESKKLRLLHRGEGPSSTPCP